MSTRYLYLVRHGQREPEASSDPLGSKLTELGWRQAHQAARRLASLKLDVIHTSSLNRTMETAQILAVEHPGIPIRPSRMLWECVPAMPEIVLKWFKAHPDPGSVTLPLQMQPWRPIWSILDDAQHLETDMEQARQAWDKYFIPARGKERHDILVCHGNLIRYFITRALQTLPEAWINMDIHNCSISQVVIEGDGRPMLISFNDTGHLHADQLTFY